MLSIHLYIYIFVKLQVGFNPVAVVQQYNSLCVAFRNEFVFYGEGLLAPRPIPKLEDRPLSFVRGCLFNILGS
jgi:hypothetical protein